MAGALEAGVLEVDADAEPKASAFARRAATFDNETMGALEAGVFDVDVDAEAEANAFGRRTTSDNEITGA